MIDTASDSDLDTYWRCRVRAALVLATWADALSATPDGASMLDEGTSRRLPPLRLHPGRQTAAMWVLAEHLSRHGGTVVPAELGRALLAHRPHSRSRTSGRLPAAPTPLPPSRSWSGTSLTGRGLLTRSSPVTTVPVGLLPDLGLAAVARRARRAAALTQPHPSALDLAATQAVAVAVVARWVGAPLEAEAVISQISAQVHTQGMRTALRRVPPLVRQSANPQRVARQLHAHPGAASTLPVALSAFLLHRDDPVAALRFAAQVGGDVRAAVITTGALCGAYHGEPALPQPIEVPARLSRVADALARLRETD